jgi:hypothetical protein
VIAYRAMLDVPRELVDKLAGLLRRERRQWHGGDASPRRAGRAQLAASRPRRPTRIPPRHTSTARTPSSLGFHTPLRHARQLPALGLVRLADGRVVTAPFTVTAS